jgi:hypothetical protein
MMIKGIFATLLLIMISSPVLRAEHKDVEAAGNYFFASQDLGLYAQSGDLNEDLYALNEGKEGNRKSVSRAILLSLALPGLGEMYVGKTSRAIGFFTAEAGIWISYAYFKQRQSWFRDDYINLAVAHAGVNPSGKNDFFFNMVGFYDNRDDYNKVSRVYTRSNPFFPETPAWDWQWESADLRSQYRDIKNSSNAQGRNANFALGFALANRVISAIDAWWSAKSYNRQFSPFFSKIQLRLTPSLADIIGGGGSPGFVVNYKYSF